MEFLRRGEMTDNTLGIVLAVIGLIGLAFLGVKLYSLFVDQDLKNAKAFINDLTTKIENLETGESNSFALRGIEDWVLVGWDLNDPLATPSNPFGRPDKCFLKPCLCLCKGYKDSPLNCQEVGFCRAVDAKDVEIFSSISSWADPYFISNFNAACLVLEKKLMGVSVSKDKDKLAINYFYGIYSYDKNKDYVGDISGKLAFCPSYEKRDTQTQQLPP